MKKFIVLGFLLTSALFAQPEKPPPIYLVKRQLADAQATFEQAKREFNPWYSGPLLTGSAHMMPPGYANWQPYLFVTSNYAAYQSNRHAQNIPDILFINPTSILQWGLWHKLDMVLTVQGVYQKQSGVSSGGFGDTTVQLGIQLIQEEPFVPAMKVYINQTFPTGKWDRSDPDNNGLDMIGAGSYVTSISLNSSKVVWWLTDHPMSLRLSLGYDLYPSKVDVRGVNAYGGAPNTRGTITPGRNIKATFGFEGSITKKWVFATDVAYVYTNKSTFSGFKGSVDGVSASVGRKSSDNISISPAIEYNWSPNLGALVGVWFSVFGRNTNAFLSGVFTIQWTFP